MRNTFAFLVLLLVLCPINGCKEIGRDGLSQVANAIGVLNNTHEQAAVRFANDNDRWIYLLGNLPKNLSQNLEQSLNESIARAKEHTGITIDYAEFKFHSNIESLREHLLDGLLEIQKNELKNVDALLQLGHSFKFTPVMAKPMWITPVVKVGDVSRRDLELDWTNSLSSAKTAKVELDGFGFQRPQRTDPSWRIEFHGPKKDIKRATVLNAWQYLTIHSDFKATLHLGPFIEQAQRDDSLLVIAYDDGGKHRYAEIDLTHITKGPPPETKTVLASLGEQSLIPKHVRGDDNFWGRVRFTVIARCKVHEGVLKTQVYMFAIECDENGKDRPDYTTAVGETEWKVAYRPEEGWRIAPVIEKEMSQSGIINEGNTQPVQYTFPNGEFVHSFKVKGVREGGRAGTDDTSVAVIYHTMTIRLEKIQPPAK